MSEPSRWTIVSDVFSVAFSLPCKGCYRYERGLRLNIGCSKPDDKHGHIELSDDEGMWALITFPCYSQAGVKVAVERIKESTLPDGEIKVMLSDEECKVILDMENIKNLPQELTEEEKAFIASLDAIEDPKKRSIFWGWWGY